MKPCAWLLFVSVTACGGAAAPATTTPNASDDTAALTDIRRAEERYEEFVQARIDCDGQANLEGFVRCLQEQVRLLSGSAMESVEAYQRVLGASESPRQDPRWAVASLSGQARTFTRMVEALNEVEVPELYPQALLEEGARMSDDARRMVQEQVSESIRQVLETQIAPITCTAVVYDVMALRVAQPQGVDSSYAQESVSRLSPFSDEQIAACVEQGRTSDETLDPYSAGELTP